MKTFGIILIVAALSCLYHFEMRIVPFAFVQSEDGTYIHGDAFAFVSLLRYPIDAFLSASALIGFVIVLYLLRSERRRVER